MKLRIRHLPPNSTVDTVKQMLEEQFGGEQAIKMDNIQFVSVSAGKLASSTKQEVCATAYVQVPNEQVAWKMFKKLQPVNLLVDIAPQQALPAKKTCSNVNNPQVQLAGTWKQDEEYLKYEAAQKPSSSSKPEVIVVPAPAAKEIPPLVTHIIKEFALQRKAKAKQTKKNGPSVTPAGAAAATTTPSVSSKPAKKQQRPKRNNKPPPSSSS